MNFTEIDWVDQRCKTNNDEDINYKFLECVRDCYLFQHVTEPTRQRGTNEPSTLDLVFTNEEHMIPQVEQLAPLGKSDHSILKFEIICRMDKKPPKIVQQINKGNYTKLKEMLGSVDWENEMGNKTDVNELWKIFTDRFYKAEKECIPTRAVYVDGKKSKRLSMPLDRKTLRKMKKKNKLWGIVRKKLATVEQETQYNKLRNQIRRLTRKAKKLTEKNIAKNAKVNPKQFWKYTQAKLKTRAGIPEIEVKEEDGTISYAKDDESKANQFQNYFGGVYTKDTDEEMPNFDERKYDEVLSNIKITKELILNKLKKIKINKSPGPDQIHPRVLNEISNEICTPLQIIFQVSLETKTLPDQWKHAQVAAIFKKGAKTKPQNYRPVSLTCIVCKLLESIIRDSVIVHMTKNKLFSPKQFGFLSGRSTTLQLLHVLNIWTEILDQGGELDVIYCDFMKAFDKVPHKRLVYKIDKYGLKGNVLGWIENFLSNRTQEVKVGNKLSKSANVTSGIPQGSVLGPILFVMYINDLPEVVDKDSFVYLFADDTKLFRRINSDQDRIQLQHDINSLIEWSNKWLLKFHPDKCVSMTINTKKEGKTYTMGEHNYTMGGHTLSESNLEKDIGVSIDRNINFDMHINKIVKNANRILAITRRTFECMDAGIFCMLYKGLIRPHLEYAAPVWSPNLKKHKVLLEKVQERAIRLVPGFKEEDSYATRLKKLKLPTLAYRRVRGDMIQMYKLLTENKDGYDKSLPSMFTYSDTELRGNSKKLFLPRTKKDIGKYKFTNRVIILWNQLPDKVINSSSMGNFETNLDKFWQNQKIKYDDFSAEISYRVKD